MPLATLILFGQANLCSGGAISLGVCPCNHGSCQDLVFFPLPIVIVVHTRNSSVSVAVCLRCICDAGSFHLNHCHRSLSALLIFSRSKTPRPPNFFGLWLLFQLTRQLPPRASSLPCHKKLFLLTLSFYFMAHLKRGKTVIW
jgi:hypothetical protein